MLKREYPASNLLLHLLDNLGKMQISNLRQVKRKSLGSIINSGLFPIVQLEFFVLFCFAANLGSVYGNHRPKSTTMPLF